MTNQQFHSTFKRNSYHSDRKFRGSGKSFIRKNERIKAKEVRVIDHEGNQLGIMQTFSAIAAAKSVGLDLVEISPNANPPVCKILDFGKFKYDESKKSKNSPKQAAVKTKEIKLRVAIDPNDYNTKMRHAIDFLEHGNKVKLSLIFRGRELARSELGFALVNKFADEVRAYGVQDMQPKLLGKMISTILSPCARKQPRAHADTQQQPSTPTKVLNADELLNLK
jgi:translation initiation factor IF-3